MDHPKTSRILDREYMLKTQTKDNNQFLAIWSHKDKRDPLIKSILAVTQTSGWVQGRLFRKKSWTISSYAKFALKSLWSHWNVRNARPLSAVSVFRVGLTKIQQLIVKHALLDALIRHSSQFIDLLRMNWSSKSSDVHLQDHRDQT